MKTAYYISDYCDEIMPCEATLQAWAKWLSKPDETWNLPNAAADGDTFDISAMDFIYIEVSKIDDEWHLPDVINDQCDFLAVAFGEGMGWDADTIAADPDSLREILDEYGEDSSEWIAIGTDHKTRYIGTYHAEGPSISITPKTEH